MAQTVLTRAEIEANDPEGGRFGRWLCPLPSCAGHTDARRHRSLNLDPASGLWRCHRCGAGGQLKDRWKPMEPRRSWEDRKADARRERERRRAAALAIVTSAPPAEPPGGALSAFRLGALRPLAGSPGGAYLAGRGIGPELAHAAGVRFAPDFGRRLAEDDRAAWRGAPAVVFPIRGHSGKLVAAQGRFIVNREGSPKMLTLGPKSAGVFATPGALETAHGERVAIVEAPIDALSLAAAGLPALALCGTSGVPAWLLDLLAWRPVLLAFDADKPKDGRPGAGDVAAAAFAEELGRVSLGMANALRLRPSGAKDWNELLTERGIDAIRHQVAAALPKRTTFAVGRPEPPMPSEGPRIAIEAPQGLPGTDVPREAPSDALREIRTKTDAPEFSEFSEAPTRAGAPGMQQMQPSTRAGTPDLADFAEPLTRAGVADRDAPPDAEELRDRERVGAALADAWRALWQGLLPIAPFELGSGRVCTRPDRWLLWAVGRRVWLLREFGPAWWDTDAGQALAQDLCTFADWYLCCDVGAPGHPAPAPERVKRAPLPWAPRWAPRPDPAAVALDSAAPWPDGPADTPERERQWSERVALAMQARGRHPADVAELAAAYGIGAELGTPARA